MRIGFRLSSNESEINDLTHLVEVEHSLLETRHYRLRRPLVFPIGIPVPANLHGLLKVGRLCFESGYFIRIRRLCYTLSTDLDISSVGAWILPSKLVL